ncbi:unnamed protein product [Staurois parvus]|uniref:Uncharacterized protein n=1 Tax=Staurois parvus TaxID=386267 RepID=A0ABN9D1W0_9NEOB|nr:unnamed protein product [Staurois parvus]
MWMSVSCAICCSAISKVALALLFLQFFCDFTYQGRTDNSWGPRAIGNHGAPVS